MDVVLDLRVYGPDPAVTTYVLMVTNRAMLGDVSNPVSSEPFSYLVLNDGLETYAGWPFAVTATELECTGERTVEYEFGAIGSATSIPVPIDGVSRLELAQSWDISVVRSSAPRCCPHPSQYAWWAAAPAFRQGAVH